MCEMLNCTPSELTEKHPNITSMDIMFMKKLGIKKMEKQFEILGKLLRGAFGGR